MGPLGGRSEAASLALVPLTLRALIAPRRSVPIAAAVSAMLAAEAVLSRRTSSVGIDLLLCLAFCLVAPTSWRVLLSSRRSSRSSTILAVAAYLALGALVVAAVGLGVPVLLRVPFTYLTDPPSIGVVVVLFAVGGWGLGRDIDLEEGLAAERDRASRLAVEAERAQLLALRSHLDPHFLFNALNAIAEWCRDDPRVAEAATLKLAAMLRTILDAIREPLWTMGRELELARLLFDLYEVRDRERYRFVLHADESASDAQVPPMILLPLLENAITHGPSAGHVGLVSLRVKLVDGRIVVEIANPGRFERRREGGQGIDTVERRIALAYDGAAHLSIRGLDESTSTTLLLPLRLPHPEAIR